MGLLVTLSMVLKTTLARAVTSWLISLYRNLYFLTSIWFRLSKPSASILSRKFLHSSMYPTSSVGWSGFGPQSPSRKSLSTFGSICFAGGYLPFNSKAGGLLRTASMKRDEGPYSECSNDFVLRLFFMTSHRLLTFPSSIATALMSMPYNSKS